MEKNIRSILANFLVKLGVDFTEVEVLKLEDKKFYANVMSNNPNRMIGRHGDHLNALQKIVAAIFHHQLGEDYTVQFDVDHYRKRQEENVLNMASVKAQEVEKTGAQIALPPMSPYFRRLVHTFILTKHPQVTTVSMGQGNYRQVILKPKA